MLKTLQLDCEVHREVCAWPRVVRPEAARWNDRVVELLVCKTHTANLSARKDRAWCCCSGYAQKMTADSGPVRSKLV